jgi:psiF repeat
MKQFKTMAAAVAAVTLLSFTPGAAFAQTTQPAPAAKSSAPAPATSTPAPSTATSKQRSTVSMECSKEADTKGLHGKARKEFRSECKKNAMGKQG